jgi:hypothetical protein
VRAINEFTNALDQMMKNLNLSQENSFENHFEIFSEDFSADDDQTDEKIAQQS